MCLDNGGRPAMCMHMSIFSKEDDVHVHSHPKYQLYAVHMCKKCQGCGLGTIKLLDKSKIR